MPATTSSLADPIDRKTSRSICDAVGERLQKNLPVEPTTLSDQLEQLMDELRKQDDTTMHFD
jgi:hypothetical protein